MPIAIRTASVALALAATAAIVPAVAAAAPATVEFTAAGSYTVVVPEGVEEIQAEVIGGEGGAGAGPDNPFPLPTPGGKGATASGTVPVTAGETLTVNVGGTGADQGGFGGGGIGGSGYDAGTGGAASSLERGDTALLVAGGGGGGGGWGGAGGAGDLPGGDVQGATQARGGEPGTATGAGDGGLGGNFPTACTTRQGGTDGEPGSGVEGGTGGAAPAIAGGGGGGGGGGWFGGGGGGGGSFCETLGQFAGGGGGGGGSSHLGASVTGGAIGTSDRTGDGLVFIAFVDAVAPTASPVATSEPVADGWSDAPVTVQWNWSDIGGAGFDFCTQETTSTGDGEQTLGATCIDREGNIGTAEFAVKVDTTPPVITPAVPAQGATFTVGAAATVGFACTDAGSGVADCSGSPAQGAALDTSSVGAHVVTLSATDAVGNATTLDVAYTVVTPQAPPSGQKPPPPPPVPEPPTATLRAPDRLVFGRPVRIGCGPEADACRVQLRRRGKLLAKGTGVAGTRARIWLTATGRRVLRRHRGGVRVTVRAVATIDGVEQTLTAKRRAVLRRP